MSLEVPNIHPGWRLPDDTHVIAAGTPHQPPATAIVLCERSRLNDEVYEYVTGDVYEHTTRGWGSGHYFNHIEEAYEDYIKRMIRGY